MEYSDRLNRVVAGVEGALQLSRELFALRPYSVVPIEVSLLRLQFARGGVVAGSGLHLRADFRA